VAADRPYRIGVLASGGGSNLQVLMDRIRAGDLPAELAFVASNNSKSGALAKAKAFGTAAYHVSSVTEGSEVGASRRLVEMAREHGIDLLVLAGYMKLLPYGLLSLLKNRIVNIHPALLPAFGGAGCYGSRVHEAVRSRGCQYSGITVHMVNEAYDEGQIVLQKAVRLRPDWTAEQIGAAVLEVEHRWYWQVVRGFAVGEIIPTGGDDPGRAVDLSRFLARMDHGEEALR
jgi:formyltetrahydrofolate-dependent phosphoribosylglycinamide formyltransferase